MYWGVFQTFSSCLVLTWFSVGRHGYHPYFGQIRAWTSHDFEEGETKCDTLVRVCTSLTTLYLINERGTCVSRVRGSPSKSTHCRFTRKQLQLVLEMVTSLMCTVTKTSDYNQITICTVRVLNVPPQFVDDSHGENRSSNIISILLTDPVFWYAQVYDPSYWSKYRSFFIGNRLKEWYRCRCITAPTACASVFMSVPCHLHVVCCELAHTSAIFMYECFVMSGHSVMMAYLSVDVHNTNINTFCVMVATQHARIVLHLTFYTFTTTT